MLSAAPLFQRVIRAVISVTHTVTRVGHVTGAAATRQRRAAAQESRAGDDDGMSEVVECAVQSPKGTARQKLLSVLFLNGHNLERASCSGHGVIHVSAVTCVAGGTQCAL
jgi:hypothetical protein